MKLTSLESEMVYEINAYELDAKNEAMFGG